MNYNIKIVFLGEDSFSNVVLESLIKEGFQVVSVISPLYNNLIHKRLERTAAINNIPYLRTKNINSDIVADQIAALKPDLIISAHFEKLLEPNIIQIPRLGCINLHPSLLPHYRGMSPQHWPIINGDPKTGVSIHFINELVDSGDIIIQDEIEIGENMYVSDLQIKMIEVYKNIVVRAVHRVLNSEDKVYTQQSHIDTPYYGRLKKENCIIDLSLGHQHAYNLIRAVSKPYMGARYGGYIIWNADIVSTDHFNSIKVSYPDNGIYFSTEFGNILKFENGAIIINKYENEK